MSDRDFHADQVWRRCEQAWAGWLEEQGFFVTRLCEAEGNAVGTRAPLVSHIGGRIRAPDLLATLAEQYTYWEVKYRTRPDIDQSNGSPWHWMEKSVLDDYVTLAQEGGADVRIALREAATATAPGRWLSIAVLDALRQGRPGARFGASGKELAAWLWPVSSMEEMLGPDVEIGVGEPPALPLEGELPPMPRVELESAERALRAGAAERTDQRARAGEGVGSQALEADRWAALEVLAQRLGLPRVPRYSVLRVGESNLDVESLLGLLDYGIRVFLVTEQRRTGFDSDPWDHFAESRMLEWAKVGVGRAAEAGLPKGASLWAVDGQTAGPRPTWYDPVMAAAESSGGLNAGQYEIVHAPIDRDVLVTAGAGTGKTETMSERLLFLLSTSREPVGLNEVGLVTFTREAAREIRTRIARTIIFRQRLSPRCVQPTLAWLMQLGSAEIGTIHSFAKGIVKRAGGPIGFSPGFAVSPQTMEFRRIVQEELGARLPSLFDAYGATVPHAYLWEQHIEEIWQVLGNNGVDMLRVSGAPERGIPIDWGDPGGGGLKRDVHEVVKQVLEGVAVRFKATCLEGQALQTSDLVPAAIAALGLPSAKASMSVQHLFVDEFQDTDAQQMDLLLAVRDLLSGSLFVVGDAKQGIYRFRGAQGNAFVELEHRVKDRGLAGFRTFQLARNFRSDGHLLDSFHPFFSFWGSSELLPYSEGDRLLADARREGKGHPVEFKYISKSDEVYVRQAARMVMEWRAEDHRLRELDEGRKAISIAVLCRTNRQAKRVHQEIIRNRGDCRLLVGGDFYRTPAVREMRVLLEALRDPDDSVSLLELLESRWAQGILQDNQQSSLQPVEAMMANGATASRLLPWADRFEGLESTGSFEIRDLEALRRSVRDIASRLGQMSAMALIVECSRLYRPEATSLPDLDSQSKRDSYGRCVTHLITLMDAQFADSPATLDRLLEWLRLQIATNRNEDEPIEAKDLKGKTTALTVHKAKGLEFDSVLIPNTWRDFGAPGLTSTRTAVLPADSGLPKLLWSWDASGSFTNSGEAHAWSVDDRETQREEARLLYVAMTRAERRLVIFRPTYPRASAAGAANPQSWADLLAGGSA